MPSAAKYQNKAFLHKAFYVILCLAFIISVVSIDLFFDQKGFFQAFPVYSVSFLLLILLYRSGCPLLWMIFAGIISRLILVFVFPGFSDDIYRFYWDGKLTVSGISPYGILPSDVLKLHIPELDIGLFEKLNSQNYYTIYPPINQLYFAVGCLFGELKMATIVMKILVFATELVGLSFIFKILNKLKLSISNSILYFLNPLVITEGQGNLHFEVVMISLLCISVYYIFNNNIIKGALFLTVSIGIKLLPLMILPYFLFRMPSKQKLYFLMTIIVFAGIFFWPFWQLVATSSFLQSLDLYFTKFEFNAGIYYIFRYIGTQITGYNLIRYFGPALGIATVFFNLRKAFGKDKGYSLKDFIHYALIVWSCYLFLATTVHPWYIVSLIFFCVFTEARFAILWSYLVFISYVNYSYDPYFENLWYIGLEYGLLVFFFIVNYLKQIKVFITSLYKNSVFI